MPALFFFLQTPVGIIVAILLTHVCVVETLDFSGISIDLEFNYTDGQVHHIRRRSADPVEYIMVVEVNASETVAISEIRSSANSVILPLQVDNGVDITAFNISTVCYLNETQYQCKCEGLFVWPNDTCHLYEACDDITDGSCTCINALPADGQFCQEPISEFTYEYEAEIDVNLYDLLLVVDLRNLVTNTNLPFPLNNNINITHIDMTTVCGLNGTKYECKCEEDHFWPNDTCRAYQVCDAIVEDTCGCIQALPSEGPLCQRDIDECLVSPSVCGPNSTCANHLGSYKCLCFDGFTATNSSLPIRNNNTCTDIDECLFSSSVCGPNANCTNEIGSYNCSCLDGFTATNSNLPISINNTCTDVNECLKTSEVCGPNSHCTNSNGSYSCFCLSRFAVINSSEPVSTSNPCNDINECLNSSVCGPNANCSNYNGSYSCSCWEGYNVTKMNEIINSSNPCIDIDECLFSPSICGPNANCTNEKGSYNCSCLNGFTATNSSLPISINNTCTDVDECLKTPEVCGPNSHCTNSIGSYSCSCLSGFTVINSSEPVSTSNPCNDINECLNSSLVCGPNANCSNYNGSYSCSCLEGYNVAKMNETINNSNPCIDINECLFSPFICGPNANCTNKKGSYNCSCLDGFTATNSSLPISINNTCTDVNECLKTPEVCGPNSHCTNSIGSYSCSCLSGFTVTNSSEPVSTSNPCNDIDECVNSSLVCGPNANCYNYNGNYSCSCWDGYNVTKMNETINTSNPCIDVNECLKIAEVCGPNSHCTNSIGSYSCFCLSGFTVRNSSEPVSTGNPCNDINECLNSSLVCGPNANCFNYNGSYSCSCWEGYNVTNMNEIINSSNPCRDIDECQFSPSVCGPNANCTNKMGSYNCACLDGFTATNSSLPISINNTCTDVNECLKTPEVCGPNSHCTNSIGSYSCSCLSGFTVANSSEPVSTSNPCNDIDECVNSSLVCGPNANCYNYNGNYSCSCWDGYNVTKMNETINTSNPCIDIDECLFSPSICGPNANCRNQLGSYNCSCLDGFTPTNSSVTISINNTCTDVNECLKTLEFCGPNSYCTNSIGSYSCSCLSGFTVTNSSEPVSTSNPCNDINECFNSLSVCGPNAICSNYIGSYSCSCWEGYSVTKMNEIINNSNPCIDIDECLFNPSVCSPNANCKNQLGGYSCSCFDGFTATNSSLPISINNTCTDVNECLKTSEVCGPKSHCTNSFGSYSCSCLSGFTVTNSREPVSTSNPCNDIDECLFSPSICGPNSTCTNEMGSYSCSCLDGFTATNSSLPISINNTCTAPPTTPSTPTPSAPPTTTGTTAPATVIGMSMTMNQIFDTSLTDPTSKTYKDLSGQIESTINADYTDKLTGYIFGSTKVSGFRPGSVIADYTISVTSNSPDFGAANTQVSDSLKTQGIVLAEDPFAQSDPTVFIRDQLYPLQKVALDCIEPVSAKGQIKWNVDNNDPALDTTRYLLSNDNRTLTVKNASEKDSGRYSCIIQRNTIPYIQWQNIMIKQRPNIIVGEKYRVFPCDGSSFQLKCTVDFGYSIEWVVGGKTQISGSDSITLNYATQKENCTEETFTCRLKDLPQLQIYSYSYSSVTVKTSPEKYDCQNEELGVGKTNEEKSGVCGKGMKGTIMYKCESNVWKSVEDNCVLEVIDNLKNELESLRVEGIPGFMANLSIATSENNINITQSAATVQAIVDILFKIADLSQATVIRKIVMVNFLNTVDIIVSGNISETWNKLNKGNNAENTSIKLLSSIENISDRLADEFAFNETSIQLNRTTVKNSLSITSALPKSTTEIVIPQVPQETTITIIIFTTLDKVLPSQGTNDSRKSDVRINGDVVVVKVNETINNISFTFDITNQSLGNPQCVFWNFNLSTWDSTGCEAKPYISEGNETGKITCECNHTTSFSILMSPFSIDHIALEYITYIGVAISMASLIICLIIETIVWKSVRRNDTSYMRHVSIVNIAVSLLIANICFIIGAAIAKPSAGSCSPVVFFMHFFYLAVFFWMLISALLLLYRTVMVLSRMSRTKMMVIAFIVGYVAPLLIAVITVASTAGEEKYSSKQACWLNWSESMALLAFVIPALTIVAINLVVLIVVLYKMLRRGVGAATQPDEKHALMVIARCVAILTPLFGLTWGFGIGTMLTQDLGIHVVFALLNSLQGFFILVLGTLLDSKVRESLPGKRFLQKLSSRTKSTSTGSSSTSGLPFLQRRRRRNVYNVSEAVTSSDGSYAVMNA